MLGNPAGFHGYPLPPRSTCMARGHRSTWSATWSMNQRMPSLGTTPAASQGKNTRKHPCQNRLARSHV